MSDPYIGEIRMFGGNFAPRQWAFCDGQLMPISANNALFSLLGTTYGGDGRTSFGIPDMRGRLPVHEGQGAGLSARPMGQRYGQESVTLTSNQIPAHNHDFMVSTSPASLDLPTSAVAAKTNVDFYAEISAPADQVPFGDNAISPDGGTQAHENRMPALTVSFIIALFGVFPSRN